MLNSRFEHIAYVMPIVVCAEHQGQNEKFLSALKNAWKLSTPVEIKFYSIFNISARIRIQVAFVYA
jgi:hypothetical protein